MEDKIRVNRGDIWLVDFGKHANSVQAGLRPAVIIQNNIGNHFSPLTIVVPITSRLGKRPMPTHVVINPAESGLPKVSMILTEQISTVGKEQLIRKCGSLSTSLERVNEALRVSITV